LSVVATAGHVDHGKSTLVAALTGMDPDRLTEEKERGLTIDLGFAWTTLPSGAELAFVDVPGHVRFIKNMLAGAGAVEACMFVVAANEGWKPQSEEHLRILELLGVEHGLVALTKVGLVDAEVEELARLEVADHVSQTFLDNATVVAVDAPTGRGLDELRAALDDLLTAAPPAADRDRPRLWIDRVFPMRGAGTVVTGTLAGGPLRVDDQLEVVPGGIRARVRGLQTRRRSVTDVAPGNRTAVNLVGVSHDRLERGQALVRPGQWEPTRSFDATLSVLAGLDHEVSRRGAYHLYAGSGEHAVRLRILGPDTLSPGETGFVRLHLPLALPLLPGDRFVLRESGRAETVGGGVVLDVAPVVPAGRARPDPEAGRSPAAAAARTVTERGWVDAELLERLSGVRQEPNVGRWVVSEGALTAARHQLRSRIETASTDAGTGPGLGLDVATLDERDRAVLSTLPDVVVTGGRARPAASDPARDTAHFDHPWLSLLDQAPYSPPPPDGIDRALLRELVRTSRVVERDGLYFSPAAIEGAAAVVARLLAAEPAGVTASAVREALGTSRKYLLPILAELDARGITRRRGDLRVPGPRLPRPTDPRD